MEQVLNACKRSVPLTYASASKAVDAVSTLHKLVQAKGKCDAAIMHQKFTAKGLQCRPLLTRWYIMF